MIVLHTLGDTLITIGDRKIRPSSPLVFASLLYLATERGRRVPRTALQELLFPKSGERSGAHSLRQLLYKLRQLGAPLEADATSVYLSADQVRDDAAVSGVSHSAMTNFLPDFEPDISERYSEWLERKRAEFAASLRKRLVASIESNRESLNWQAVERDAQLLLSVDPFNEVGTFALAEAVALSGGKAAAMRILSEYERETGRTDLRLPASLLRRRISQTVPDAPVPTLSALPFVGRDAEVKELRKYIARARSGQPCLYVIGGEAGIGKSRLLTEVAGLAALEGMAVFTVRCQSHYGSRPLSVFIELVPALLDAPGALGIAPQSLTSLTSLTQHRGAEPDRAPDFRDDMTRSDLLLAALRDLIDALAAEQPLLLAVEDAHWADHDSLRELNRLVQGVMRRSLLIACTTRAPDIFPHSPVTDDRTVIRRLNPLAASAVKELATRLLPTDREEPSNDLLQWSIATAGGNPLFLQMICSHYAATGEAYTVPADVLTAVTRRVEQLPEAGRRILALCALLGKHAQLDILRALSHWDHLEMFEAMQRLEREGYLTFDSDVIRIAHDLVSQAALSLVPPVSLRILHGCVAAALEHRYAQTNDASLLWDCAVQWEQSAESTKAIEFLLQCSRHATEIGRASEALKLLTRAEQLAKSSAEKIAILRESVVTAQAGRQSQLTTEFALRLRQLAPDAHEHSTYELAVHQALWASQFTGNESISRLLACATATGAASSHRIEAAHLLVCIAHETGNADLAAKAFGCVRHLDDSLLKTSTSRTLAAVYEVCFGDRVQAKRLINEIVNVRWQFASVADELRTALIICGLLAMLGESKLGSELATRYYHRSQSLSLPVWQMEFATHICTLLCIEEDFATAERWLQLVDNDALQHVSAGALRHSANQVEIAISRGDRETAATLLSQSELGRLGDSLRGKAYFKSLEIRCKQLDSSYQMEDEDLDEVRCLHRQTKRLACADAITVAYAEALARRGMYDELHDVLHSYLSVDRREEAPLPRALQRLVDDSLGTWNAPARALGV